MINNDQFGYKAGYYHYCLHLSNLGHHIIYLCNDHHHKRVSIPNVDVIYINEPNSIKWRIQFCKELKQIISYNNIDIALCSYFRGCSILKFFLRKVPTIMDIRSGDLASNNVLRYILNKIIKFEALWFNHIMILSESLAQLLNLKRNTYNLVSLGADVIDSSPKNFTKMNAIYVGTLNKRDIHNTIIGFNIFREKYPNINFNYDIIGFGTKDEENIIKHLIHKYNLSDEIKFHGRINYENLPPFFAKANIGIAYVPMTPYFDCQPSTKIFEYELSGMYCIATNTSENKLIINQSTGLLCDDNANSFFLALEHYYLSDKSTLSSENIKISMQKYTWNNIVKHQLLPILSLYSCQRQTSN